MVEEDEEVVGEDEDEVVEVVGEDEAEDEGPRPGLEAASFCCCQKRCRKDPSEFSCITFSPNSFIISCISSSISFSTSMACLSVCRAIFSFILAIANCSNKFNAPTKDTIISYT